MTRLPLMQHAFLFLNALVLLVSQLLLKIGLAGTTLSLRSPKEALGVVKLVLTSPALLAGVILGATSTLLWIVVLSRLELSYAAPLFNATYYVLLVIGSVVVLHEHLDVKRLIGVVLIVAGIALMSSSPSPGTAKAATDQQSNQ